MTCKTTIEKIYSYKQGSIGHVLINNESKHNAMSLAMWKEIPAAISRMDDDPDVFLIAISGAGNRAFVSGADITEFDEVRKDTASAISYDHANAECYRAVRNAKKPTIALIKGFCMGGGFGLAAACDLRLSNKSGRFSIPAAKLGISYPTEAIADIVRLIGPANAKALYLTAQQFDASAIGKMGFLNEVFEDELFDAKAISYCETIAALAPLSHQFHKAAINAAASQPESPTLDTLQKMASACLDSDDYREGRKAFAEKRKPIFSGK